MPLFLPPQPAPLIVSDGETIGLMGSSQTLTANAVYLWAFEIFALTTFTGAKLRIVATATGTTDIGIYTFTGSLLIDTGAIANVANTNMSNNFTANLSIDKGQYFMALCPSNATDTYL